MDGQTAQEVLHRLQEELKSLQLSSTCGGDAFDFGTPTPSKGSGPRLFCGHVPKEATEDVVKAHFSRWGIVTDVYFPRHKKTLKRRPFCFVTFAAREAAERALAESPLNICGIPIKNLTMVEDRDKYYKEKHAAAHQALMSALSSMGANGALAPEQVNNIAALLAMEGMSSDTVLGLLVNAPPPPGGPPPDGNGAGGRPPAGMQPHMAQHPGFSHPPSSGGVRFSSPGALGAGGNVNALMPGHHAASYHPGMHAGPRPSDFLMHHHQRLSTGDLPAGHAMRSSTSGPLPPALASPGPFSASMVSRESSICSVTSGSDWYSRGSSARNSVDFNSISGGSSGMFGPLVSNTRHSMDAAIQLRQQLIAAAGVAAASAGGSMMAGAAAAMQHSQWVAAANAAGFRAQQQAQQAHQGANVMQSAFYQPSPAAPSSRGGSPQQQAGPVNASSFPLPPISEGFPSGSAGAGSNDSRHNSSLWGGSDLGVGAPLPVASSLGSASVSTVPYSHTSSSDLDAAVPNVSRSSTSDIILGLHNSWEQQQQQQQLLSGSAAMAAVASSQGTGSFTPAEAANGSPSRPSSE